MPIAVLTGGTSGLGRFVARGLVRAGWRLVLIARDPSRSAATRAWLLSDTPGAEIEIEPADLSLLSEARAAAAAISARHPAIGLLVLNAGTFQARRQVTAEGHELVLATNHLVPFALIGALQSCLQVGNARVIAVGSSASDRARIEPADLELRRGWNLVGAYGQSKLALMITSFEWGRRLAPAVSVNVVHPGFVATDLVRTGGIIGWVWRRLALVALTAEQGAEAPLRAALDPALAGVTGRYIVPKGFGKPNRRAADPALATLVWQATQRLIANEPSAD